MDLQQSGKKISGSAAFQSAGKDTKFLGILVGGHDVIYNKGVVSGDIQGDDIVMKIEWGNNTTGMYRGRVGPQGRAEGSTYHKQIPSNKATWYIEEVMTCADAPASKGPPSQNSRVKPARSGEVINLGQPKVPGSNSTAPLEARTSSGDARIFASPKAVNIPAGQKTGSTMLGWDGGADHPYAEVWVGVDGGEPTRMVEQGKGTRRFTVEAGKTYRFILTDSGQDLATATVTAR